jgi:hypothetical protein
MTAKMVVAHIVKEVQSRAAGATGDAYLAIGTMDAALHLTECAGN